MYVTRTLRGLSNSPAERNLTGKRGRASRRVCPPGQAKRIIRLEKSKGVTKPASETFPWPAQIAPDGPQYLLRLLTGPSATGLMSPILDISLDLVGGLTQFSCGVSSCTMVRWRLCSRFWKATQMRGVTKKSWCAVCRPHGAPKATSTGDQHNRLPRDVPAVWVPQTFVLQQPYRTASN